MRKLSPVFDLYHNYYGYIITERVTDISYTEATVDWEEWESESDSDEQ